MSPRLSAIGLCPSGQVGVGHRDTGIAVLLPASDGEPVAVRAGGPVVPCGLFGPAGGESGQQNAVAWPESVVLPACDQSRPLPVAPLLLRFEPSAGRFKAAFRAAVRPDHAALANRARVPFAGVPPARPASPLRSRLVARTLKPPVLTTVLVNRIEGQPAGAGPLDKTG